MATYEIHSRSRGRVVFRCPEGGGYVRVSDAGQWMGRQPCEGGSWIGETLLVRDAESLRIAARRWWRQWRQNQRAAAEDFERVEA